MKPRVLVSTPNTGSIHKMVARARLQMALDPAGTAPTFIDPTHRPLEDSYAHVMRDVMIGSFDFLLSIDSDNPPLKNPLELAHLDLDIVGCPTPIWNDSDPGWPIYFNALTRSANGWNALPPERRTGLQEVDAIGFGCWMVARRVLESFLGEQPFQGSWTPEGMRDDGIDFRFCRRAKEKGWKVWANFDYPCDHYCELPLMTVHRRLVTASNA